MSKPSKYTEQLLQYLESDENYTAMLDWIETLPEIDQPGVFREMEAVFKERYLKTGEQDWLDKANLIANGVADFEEEILDNKLEKALFMMQFDNRDFETEKVELFLIESRKAIIRIYLSNPDNRIEIIKIVRKLIKLEKELGIYDNINWIAIL